MKKRWIAAVLAIAVFCSAFAMSAFGATDETSPFERKLYPALDKLIYGLVDGIAAMIVTPRSWVDANDYSNETFLPGLGGEDFLDAPADGAQWSLGYANASIQTGKELTEEHYVGGSLKVTKKLLNDRLNVALFCNKLIDANPSYKSNGATIRRHVTPYFGLELNVKL